MHGGSGSSTLYSSLTGGDSLYGGSSTTDSGELRARGGDNLLKGGAGSDTLYGGSGHDRLVGGIGNTTINTGSGDAVIKGGTGHTAVYVSAVGNDTIKGGADTTVQFNNKSGYTTSQPDSHGVTTITFNNGQIIHISHVDPSHITFT